MYIYTESGERLVPAQTNIITLKADDGYIYVDKSTYEQATVLNHKYCSDYDGLCKLVGGTNHADLVKFYYDNIPEPMNILAPFIGIIDASTQFDGTLEELVGCLHVIARSIDFTKFVKIPAEIRNTVTFSDHIRKEYEIQWREFINECVPYQYIYDVFAKEGTFANAKIPTFTAAPSMPVEQPVSPTVSATTSAEPEKPKKRFMGGEAEITLADPNDAAMAALASNESLLADLFGEDDSFEDMDLEAELAALGLDPDGHPLDPNAKKEEAPVTPAASTPTPAPAVPATTSSSAIPEAESGKSLLDEWGL